MTTAQLQNHSVPKSNRFFGELSSLQSQPLTTLNRWARTYPSCAKVHLGLGNSYIVSTPEYIQQVLQKNHRKYIKEQRTMKIIRRSNAEKDNLFTSDGDFWLRQRRLMQPAFHRKTIAQFGELITDVAQTTAQIWHDHPKYKPINAHKAMIELTMNVMSRAFLGVAMGEQFNRVKHLFAYVLDYVVHYSFSIIQPPLWVPTKYNRDLRKAYLEIKKLLSETITLRRQAIESGDEPHHLLDLLMMSQDEETGEALSEQQLIAELVGIVIAGHETTASALGFLWYVLAQNPEIEANLHAELDEVLGGRIPSVEDLPKLRYLQMVLNETLRMYPPAWITTRQAIEDDSFGDVLVPATSQVIVNVYGVHQHPAYWDAPEQFRPERFEQEPVKYAFIPFGAGPRKCIGDMFAMVDAQLVVATLAQQFRLRLAPQADFKQRVLFLLEPENEWMLIQTR